MDRIRLPFLPATATFEDAVGAMRDAQVLAFVRAEPDGRRFVVTLDELIDAYRSGSDDAGAAEPQRETTSWTRPSTDYENQAAALQEEFDRRPEDFVFLRTVEGEAEVVTRHEDLAAAMRGHVVICRCRSTRRHIFQPRDVVKPGQCNYGDDAVDCG